MDCSMPKGNHFMHVTCVGGNHGRASLLCKVDDGKLVKKVGMYFDAERECIQGIHVTYTDDTESGTKGKGRGVYDEITLEPGETIKEAVLWDISRDHSTRIGRVKLKTSRNQIFSVGRDTGLQKQYPVQVGSGYLAGFTVRSAIDLSMVGFNFLKQIREVLITDVEFVRPLTAENISSELLATSKFSNNSLGISEYEFTNSIERTNTHSVTSSSTQQFPKNLKIKVGFPKLVEAGGEIKWETGKTSHEETTKSITTKLEWKLSGRINPGDCVTCTARCQYGEADIDYNSRVTVTFAGASDQWTFKEAGTLRSSEFAFSTAEAVVSKVQTVKEWASKGGTAAILTEGLSQLD